MKKFTKLFLILATTLAILFVSASVAMADNLKMSSEESKFNLKQDKCSTTSITLSWNDATIEGEDVIYWAIWDGLNSRDENEIEIYDSDQTTCTINNCNSGACLPLYLVFYGSQNGVEGYYYCDYTIASTKYSKDDFEIANLYSSSLSFRVADTACTGARVEVRKASSGTLVSKKIFSKTSPAIKISKNIVYKYKMQPYYKDDEGNIYYGEWSSYKYFDRPSGTFTTSNSFNGCDLKLKGIKKVSSYRIYVSSTGEEGTFKKTKTVKPAVGKSVTYRINKIGTSSMKKNRTYYIRIVPVINSTESQIYGKYDFVNNYY